MRALTLLVCLSIASGAMAAPPSGDELAALAAEPRWQALMHVNKGATFRGVGEAYVDDDAFFLADDGKRDPAAELRASLEALQEPGSEARCRFPARYRFLAEALQWREDEPLAHCDEYHEWRGHMPIGQLVLVFPAAYLNSPSSMFGHTLLRLDRQSDPDSVWLSQAINFGARVEPDDNSLFYIWRGLGGGYPGRFSIVPYVKKIQEYGHLENRDMWEYALDLDRDELDWVVRHLWELRDINFDYYFFDENCSFRLLELIQVGRPTAPLMEEFRFAELPVNTIRALYDADLVVERRYRPSKAEQLTHLASLLEPDELALAKALTEDPGVAESPRFQAHPQARRHLMAKVAYQAVRFEHRIGPREDEVAGKSFDLLRLIRANEAPESTPPVPEPAPPESGHETEMLALGGGRRDGADFVELGYRLTYHDVLDPVTGFLPGAGIEGFNLRLRSTEGEAIKLERLDLVNIRSLAPRTTFNKPISWFVHGGIERVRSDDRRPQARFIQGGPGLSWRRAGFQPYGFAVARAENVAGADPAFEVGGGGELGLLYHAPGVQLGLSTRGIYFGDSAYRHRSAATVNVPVARNDAVRATCEHEGWRGGDENECRMEWRHYFD